MTLRRNTPLFSTLRSSNVFGYNTALLVRSRRIEKPQFVIGGSVIEYVDNSPHLGHIIASSNEDNLNIVNRRNSLCGLINDI